LVLAAAAFSLAETWQAQTNVLYRNGRWIDRRAELELSVAGSLGFLTARPPLAGNHLDLGSYWGTHDVAFREPLDLEEVRFDFRLAPDAALAFLYGDEGLQLSNWS